MRETNRKIILARRPTGLPQQDDFKLIQDPVPAPGADQVLLKTLYISVDPYMRGRMRDRESYAAAFPLDEPVVGAGLGEVVQSNHPELKPGDVVVGRLAWQDYNVAQGGSVQAIDADDGSITAHLGVLGSTGLTAYFGLLKIGQPERGETVVVSAAAGAVGSVVGQVARIKGCRVVGTAGSPEKIAFITDELGFDEGINYRDVAHIRAALRSACPNGIDVYFDNVGGSLTDAVFDLINYDARIVICGQISQYNYEEQQTGPRHLGQLIGKSARVEGFLIRDFADRFSEGREQLAQWLRQGELRYRETIVEGLEKAPQAFIGLFRGDNIGKYLVKVHDRSR